MSNVIVHRKREAYKGFFRIDEVEFTIPRFNGGTLTQKRLVFERGDASAALVHNLDTDEIIFTNQFRYPTYEKGPDVLEMGKGWILELPAGIVRDGEMPDQCIKRELLEEIGYKVEAVEFISNFYVSPGGTSERIFCFYAPVRSADLIRPEASGVEEEGEDIARVKIPRRECYQMLDRGDFWDGKTVIALQWLRLRQPD